MKKRGEEADAEALRQLWRSRMFGLMWGAVGALIWFGILAYMAQAITQGVKNYWRW